MKISIMDFRTQLLMKVADILRFIPQKGDEIVINSMQYEVKHIRFDLDNADIKIYVDRWFS